MVGEVKTLAEQNNEKAMNAQDRIKDGTPPSSINETTPVESVDTAGDATGPTIKSMMEGKESQKIRGVPNGYQMRGECYMFGVKPNTMGTGKQWSTPITPGQPKSSAGDVVKKAQEATLDTSFRDMVKK